MILIDDHTDEDLAALADEHYSLLNPTKLNGDYAIAALIAKIDAAKLDDVNDLRRSMFWNYLITDNYQNLKRIIVSRPSDLAQIIIEINYLFGDDFFCISHSYYNADLTGFGEKVKEVFNYQTRYRSKDFSRDHIAKLDLQFCPYCNKEGISIIVITDSVTGAEKTQALLQVDHFFPQVRYPYLALSFFNLIPACAYCNGTLKGEKDFNLISHFNPYHKSFDDHFKFYMCNTITAKSGDIIIDKKNNSGHAESAVIDFRLIERYNTSEVKDEIFAGYRLISNRNSRTLRAISNALAGVLPVFSNQDVLDAFRVPNEKRKIASHRLGKLKRDICIELGLI